MPDAKQTKINWLNNFKELGEFVAEIAKVVLISLAIILPVRHFIVKPFYVKGASMQPTFENHEYLLIDEFSYHFSKPERGEVVVFKYPRDPSEYFIKRVIGTPGDLVEINNGKVTVKNGDEIVVEAEDYLPDNLNTGGSYSETIPEGHYFLMGDNRSASLDSRVFGPVAEKYLTGRVWVRAWPFDRFTVWGFDDIPGVE